ncbi:uncharacterized protein LOC127286493 [Leptopilina boulardi]|uniref:uncharacterized protein LOC127286493 n=1 Tax=Leptopilina boulardi TaxID=63433 RepID=UPI0021F615B8|nr:uncharacterized protein LOC127286493 [Leptopilina boulardi]
MKNDWFTWKSEREFKILYKHAYQGRLFIILFLVIICACWFEFLVEHIFPLVLDIIKPLNQSRPKKINLDVEYYVNQDENYFWITLHICHTNTVMITIIVSTDAIFIAFLYHACGELSILGFKLKNIGKRNCNQWNADKNIMQEIKFCAKKHDSLLMFISGICNCFSTRYFIVVGCTVILLISAGVQIMMNLSQLNMESVLSRFIFCHIFHVFCINFSCQRLTNHSLQFFRNIYDGYWYELSNNNQKMILMIMIRSTKQCKFTGGKLYTFTMSNFAMILNMSLSYLNILKFLTTI